MSMHAFYDGIGIGLQDLQEHNICLLDQSHSVEFQLRPQTDRD